jgi:tripartite-type tricarboxylate transporter receptor subunit TctC
MSMKCWKAVLAASLLLLALGRDASAQSAPTSSWPNGPVKMFVGFAAGGSTDIIARDIGHEL